MNNSFVEKVFKWFSIGLFVTFAVAYLVSITPSLVAVVYNSYIIICLLEVVLAIVLGVRIYKMSDSTAKILYLGYTALTGLTFSSIFIVYEITSIIWVFLATAITFALFSFIGKRVNINLRSFGIFLLIALLSVVILEFINLFILSNTLDIVLCFCSLIIFVCYIAYDVNKICRMSMGEEEKYAVIGAFDLYLDFINVFVDLLRLFGREKD